MKRIKVLIILLLILAMSCSSLTIEAATVKINKSNLTLFEGESSQLKITGTKSKVKWTSSNKKIATVGTTGKVKAVKQGKTIINAKVNNKTIKCDIVVKPNDKIEQTNFKPIKFGGKGSKVITDIDLSDGIYKVISTHDGKSNFIIYSYIEDDKKLLVNEIGVCKQQGLLGNFEQNINDMYLEIKADGNWEIEISQLPSNGTASVFGNESCVSKIFDGNGKLNVAKLNYSGSSNFIIKLHSLSGKRQLLVNEIDDYTGEVIVKLDKNERYFYEIIADGKWILDIDGIERQEIITEFSDDYENNSGISEEDKNNSSSPSVDDDIKLGKPFETPSGHSVPLIEISTIEADNERTQYTGFVLINNGNKDITVNESIYNAISANDVMISGKLCDVNLNEVPQLVVPAGLMLPVAFKTNKTFIYNNTCFCYFQFSYDGVEYVGVTNTKGDFTFAQILNNN